TKLIPRSLLFYFILICLLSLYSLYIGTYNTDSFKHTISLGERYAKITVGLYYLLTQKLGFPVLLFMIGLNTIIIKRKYYKPEGHRILFLLKWIGIFSAIYILLLPFGGYRIYRPDIIRYDSIMPITIALLFIYGYSSLYLINFMVPKFKGYYLAGIILFLFIYTNADKPFVDDNTCERQALEKIATSTEEIVPLSSSCTVMSWERISDYKYSETNAEMLQYWNVTTKKRFYYQQ
ncbi:MAG TPA: hypothetical protein VF411_12335, partial [Bacteroidia bacterium]